MNNNSLIKIINLYGGNNDSINDSINESIDNKDLKKYKESLLEIYNENEKNNLSTKINNLKALLIDDSNNKNHLKYLINII